MMHPFLIVLIVTSPITACVILGVLMGVRVRRLQQFGAWTECPECRYSLEGLSECVPCPECGLADPRNAPRRVLRPRFQWTGTVILCFGAAAVVLLFMLDIAYQSIIADTWNGFRRFDHTHQFTRYVALANTPATMAIWLVAVPMAVLAYMWAKRFRRPPVDLLEIGFLAASHIGLCVLGFFVGLFLAWLDTTGRHEHILLWTYGGSLA